jgi:hypothetical protein
MARYTHFFSDSFSDPLYTYRTSSRPVFFYLQALSRSLLRTTRR